MSKIENVVSYAEARAFRPALTLMLLLSSMTAVASSQLESSVERFTETAISASLNFNREWGPRKDDRVIELYPSSSASLDLSRRGRRANIFFQQEGVVRVQLGDVYHKGTTTTTNSDMSRLPHLPAG